MLPEKLLNCAISRLSKTFKIRCKLQQRPKKPELSGWQNSTRKNFLDEVHKSFSRQKSAYESIATVGEIRVWWRADFQSGSRVLKKVFWTFSYLYLWHTM